MARRPGQRVSRPDLRGRGGLSPPRRAPAGDRLRLRGRRKRPLALRQPPDRGDPRLHAGGMDRRPDPLGPAAAPRRPRARPRPGAGTGSREPSQRPADRLSDASPATATSSGSSTSRCSNRTPTASRSGTASSTTSPSARSPRRSCAGRSPSRRPSPGSPATRSSTASRDALMDEAVSLMVEIDGVDCACIWEVGRDGRRLQMLAGAEIQGTDGSRRASAARNSHAGAALESGLHVIVDDWETEGRFSMPPALRVMGVRSSLAVPIDGREQPVRRPRHPLARAESLHPAGRPLRPGLGQRPRRCGRAPRDRPRPPAPRPPRLAHRPPQPDQLRPVARGRPPARRRRRHPGRGPVPRPRQLQARQRQHRPPRRRRTAARDRPAPAVAPAPRRHRRPLRWRRVRDPDRPPRRRGRGDRDRQPGHRGLRRAVLDRGRRAFRQRQHRDRRRPPLAQRADRGRVADPRRRRGDVPGQGAGPRPQRALRRRDAGPRGAAAGGRARPPGCPLQRRAAAPLPAAGRPAPTARSSRSRPCCGGSIPGGRSWRPRSSSRSPRIAG